MAWQNGLETMKTELEGGVLTMTLHRPDRLNAFNVRMGNDWLELLDAVDADDEVRVMIVTGEGRGFCAGPDLASGGATFDPAGGVDPGPDRAEDVRRDFGGRVTLRIDRSLKPIIAAFSGPAVGVGITGTLPMDVRIASTKARFGFVFSRRGIVPEAASSWFLPRAVGISQAMQWVASGRVFEAEEALRGGLVSEVVEPDRLLPRAREIAREIAENRSGVSVALARQMMWKMLGASHPMDAHRMDSRAMDFMGPRADSKEGVESFLEKRAAEFSMRVSRDFPYDIAGPREPTFEE